MKGISKNINQLLLNVPRGSVITGSWLSSNGINYRLQHHYSRASGLLKRIGVGAYILNSTANNVEIEGALYALQSQLHLNLNIGALSALNIHNTRHFIPFSDTKLQIFTHNKLHIPLWFIKKLSKQYELYKTHFLSDNTGIQPINYRGFELFVSSPERAIIESIFLCPNEISLREIVQIMETMTNLRPNLLQELLIKCSSIKVKRIFLYLAEKQKHDWYDFIDLKNIKLGSGKRVVNPGGKLDKKYLIVIDNLSEI
ncbi:MAG: type IV toxin-antitoxin system AbiEi family antitoxin [Holosporaceae bacterium]|jgi:hypothetical protein|nr:type IV toxin-antitoxin system AbiEi family antitoxin [Holosporaceae bacterium]